jgi:hypothetical protein
MTALVLAAIGSMGRLSTRSSAAANTPIAISINDLQRSIETQSLPVQEIENPIWSTTAAIAKRPWQPWQ